MAKDAGSGRSDLISPAHRALLLILSGHVWGQVSASQAFGHFDFVAQERQGSHDPVAEAVDAVSVVGFVPVDFFAIEIQ